MMTEQMKLTIAKSLEARMTQCQCELEKLQAGPAFATRHEHLSYWQGEKTAAAAALYAIHAPEFGA